MSIVPEALIDARLRERGPIRVGVIGAGTSARIGLRASGTTGASVFSYDIGANTWSRLGDVPPTAGGAVGGRVAALGADGNPPAAQFGKTTGLDAGADEFVMKPFDGAIIAGNRPEERVEKLKAFWEYVAQDEPSLTSHLPHLSHLGTADWMRPWTNAMKTFNTLSRGIPGFFQPRRQIDRLGQHQTVVSFARGGVLRGYAK